MRLKSGLRFKFNDIQFKPKLIFVPKHEPIKENDIKKLEDFLLAKPNVLVLTGAGISTESGIPDYRSEGVGMYARTSSRPVQFMDFLKSKKNTTKILGTKFRSLAAILKFSTECHPLCPS